MKKFEKPEMEIIRFNTDDIIVASNGIENGTPSGHIEE